VRWWNLFYCGGWFINGPKGERYSDNINTIEAVINKEKPMGFEWFENDKIPELVDKIKKTCLSYAIEPSKFLESKGSFLGVAQQMTFGQAFNIKKWLQSYKLMGQIVDIVFLDEEDEE